jgi:hypothetical protein
VFFKDRCKKRGQGGEELGTGDSCHSVGKTNELKVEKIKEKKGGETRKLSVYRVHVHFVQIRGVQEVEDVSLPWEETEGGK